MDNVLVSVYLASRNVPTLLTFASGIHGIITLQNLPGMFLNLGNRSTCCAECHHKAKRGATGGDGANRSLLEREQYDEHYQDIGGIRLVLDAVFEYLYIQTDIWERSGKELICAADEQGSCQKTMRNA